MPFNDQLPAVVAGTGTSRELDSYEAGRAAALQAVAPLGGMSPGLAMVFTTPRHDLPALLAGVRSVTGSAPLIGATGSGEIVQGEYLGFGEGVGVMAMTSGPYRFGIASASHIRPDLEGAGKRIALESQALVGPSPHAAALLLADSLLGDLQKLFQGVYRVAGPKIAIFGAGAGDEQKFVRTVVFHDDKIVEEGALLLWIASDHPLEVITQHGWYPIGVPLLVTRAAGTQVFELGGRPAAEAYEEQLGLEPGQLSAAEFWGTSIRHPLGLIQADGTTIIRVARSKSSDGTLTIQGCVPPTGSAVQVMASTTDSLMGVAETAVRGALEGRPSAGVVLTFSCAARATLFGARVSEEARLLRQTAGTVPTFGFYCCAEFARTAGVLGTHNATLTALAL